MYYGDILNTNSPDWDLMLLLNLLNFDPASDI